MEGIMVGAFGVTVLLSLLYIMKYIEDLRDETVEYNLKIKKLTGELVKLRLHVDVLTTEVASMASGFNNERSEGGESEDVKMDVEKIENIEVEAVYDDIEDLIDTDDVYESDEDDDESIDGIYLDGMLIHNEGGNVYYEI